MILLQHIIVGIGETDFISVHSGRRVGRLYCGQEVFYFIKVQWMGPHLHQSQRADVGADRTTCVLQRLELGRIANVL